MKRTHCEVSRNCNNLTPPGMLVCADCANQLAIALITVPLLANALDDAHTKTQRFASAGGRGYHPDPDESPVPFNGNASEARAVMLHALLEAGDFIARDRGYHRPLDTFTALAGFLGSQVSWIRAHHNGPAMVRRLLDVVRDADRVVDRPADYQYLGVCEYELDGGATCTAELYAHPARLEVECRGCGAVHPIKERRAWLRGLAEDRTLTPTKLCQAVDGLGVQVTPKQIENWTQRGRIEPVGHTLTKPHRPLYRVGDVVDLVEADALRRDAATSRTVAIQGSRSPS